VNPPPSANRLTVGLIYLAAVMQGLALVTFPAASSIFASPSGFGLTSTQYGALFIPQVALAILASALGPSLARRLGMRGVLLLGLGGDVLSMALLAASPLLMGSPSAFFLLCAATGALGLGFGATVMALNTLTEGLFPGRADGAVLALNALLGLGTALAPVLVTLFTALGAWWALPLLMSVFAAVLLFAFASLKAPLDSPSGAVSVERGIPARFWLYAAAALLYGLVETLNGNWATVYLSAQRHISAEDASFALTAFWVMTTAGRVIFALLGRWLPAKWVYVALPVLLAVVFQFVAHVDSAAGGIVGFGAAGLACSALLPLSISLSGAEFPSRAATMSGEMIAFYQLGYGVAAFGVGPLREIGGFTYSQAFSAGSFVALGLAAAALLIARGTSPSRRPGTPV
jgi:MFS transporter, FHS family, glucose/mannose:H+ symporter